MNDLYFNRSLMGYQINDKILLEHDGNEGWGLRNLDTGEYKDIYDDAYKIDCPEDLCGHRLIKDIIYETIKFVLKDEANIQK